MRSPAAFAGDLGWPRARGRDVPATVAATSEYRAAIDRTGTVPARLHVTGPAVDALAWWRLAGRADASIPSLFRHQPGFLNLVLNLSGKSRFSEV